MAFHIARDQQQLGVFSEAEVRARRAAGDFRDSDLAWTEGMEQWKPLGEVLNQAEAEAEAGNPYQPPAAPIFNPIKTGGTAPLATLGQRLGAALLDGLVMFIAFIPFLMVMGMEAAAGGEVTASTAQDASFVLLGLFLLLILVIAVVNIVLLVRRGQTIGKRLVGIRIVGVEHDDNPGWVHTIILRGFVNGLIGVVPVLGGIYSIVDILFIFRDDRRCIHDHIAGTRVVQGQPQLP